MQKPGVSDGATFGGRTTCMAPSPFQNLRADPPTFQKNHRHKIVIRLAQLYQKPFELPGPGRSRDQARWLTGGDLLLILPLVRMGLIWLFSRLMSPK